MRRLHDIAAVGVAGLVLTWGSAAHAATVGVLYVGAAVSSGWASPAPHDEQSDGLLNGDFDPAQNFTASTPAEYLASTWTRNYSRSSIAPIGSVGVEIGGGSAIGVGELNTGVTSSTFSATGQGAGTVSWSGGNIAELYATGTSQFRLKFDVPSDAQDYRLVLTGNAASDAYTVLTVRLTEFLMSGQSVLTETILPWGLETDGLSNATDVSTPLDDEFALRAGYRYVIDCYANANSPWADAVEPSLYTSGASFDLSGSIVPEPAVYAVALAGTSLLSVRRRVSMTQR